MTVEISIVFIGCVCWYPVVTFNYKEGTKTITFAEIEEAFGSDLSSLTAPDNKRSFDIRLRLFFYMSKGGEHMTFFISNLILLLLCLFTYWHFRSGVYSYCRISKMSKTFIRKNTKGLSNFWLYSNLHKQKNLGSLYYLNSIYLFSLAAFLIAFALSWISYLKIPVIIVGIILGIATIPVFFASLTYTNIKNVGRPFVFFDVYKWNDGQNRSFATVFDWFFGFFPLAIYILLLTSGRFNM